MSFFHDVPVRGGDCREVPWPTRFRNGNFAFVWFNVVISGMVFDAFWEHFSMMFRSGAEQLRAACERFDVVWERFGCK